MATRLEVVVFLAFIAVGCGKHDKPDCKNWLAKRFDHARDAAFVKLINPWRVEAKEMLGVVRDTLVDRCTRDNWSTEAITCFGESKTDDDVKKCRTRFTDSQRQSLQTETMIALSSRATPAPLLVAPPYPSASVNSFGDLEVELHSAMRELNAANLRGDPRSTKIEEDLERAHTRAMNGYADSPEVPFEAVWRRALHLAVRDRLEVAMPALILTREPDGLMP